jgi:hypothetical protein
MSNRFYLGAPIDADGWANLETLKYASLYSEFEERIEDIIELIRDGEQHWADHRNDEGEWSADALRVLGAVRQHSHNIHQRIGLFQDDVAHTIRYMIGDLSVSSVSDSQYVAALTIDRGCRAIEELARWLREVDDSLYVGGRASVFALFNDHPKSYKALLQEIRSELFPLEIEARESVANLIGAGRQYLILARVYASPVLSSSEKSRIFAKASKGGKGSGVSRNETNLSRDENICRYGRRLRDSGRTKSEALDAILQTNAALKEPGDSRKLSRKQLGNILVKGGIFS